MAGPWEQFQPSQPAAVDGPWAKYRASTSDQGMSLYDRANDDAKSIQSGVTSGALETAGMFGSARDLQRNIIDRGAQYMGASPETAKTISDAAEWLNPLTKFAPSGAQLKQATNFQTHVPQTPEGPYLGTTAEIGTSLIAAPGSLGNKALSAPVIGVATEGAGQLAHAIAPQWEPQVRAASAIISSLLTGKPNIKEMSTAELKAVKDTAYRVADANGEVIAPEVFDQILNRVGSAAYEAGARPHLTDKSIAALKYVDELSGKPVPIPELDKARQLLKSPGLGPDGAERNVSGRMVAEFDQALNENAINSHADARKANTAYKSSQLVDDLNHKIDLKTSRYTMSGKENATRDVYRALAGNESKTRYMDKATKDAIDKVAMGGAAENSARMVGKFAPTGVLPVMTAISTGRVDLAAALMIPGMAGRMAATVLTNKNRRLAEALIKKGGEEGLRSFKEIQNKRSSQALARALLSAESSQGTGSR